MKLTADTRINAVIMTSKKSPVVLFTENQNITLGDYLEAKDNLAPKNSPDASQLLKFDFNKESEYINSYGHRFNVLSYEDKEYSCSIVKLDLAGTY